jgi:hypothetical protein
LRYSNANRDGSVSYVAKPTAICLRELQPQKCLSHRRTRRNIPRQ